MDSLKVVNRKHDLIGIKLYDPAESKLPKLGLAKVKDPETGSAFWIDTSSEKALKELRNQLATTQTKFEKESRSIGFDLISISTNEDFVEPLLSLFKMREKRN